MASSPKILLIHASDSPLYLEKLNEILHNLKVENRIASYHFLNFVNDPSSLSENLEGDDLMLVLLSKQLELYREQLERKLVEIQTIQPDIRVAEILVDNLRYDNRFTTLPADLKPLRSREDLDVAWNNIEHNLKEMFPIEMKEKIVLANWSKYLKIAGILIVLIVAFFIYRSFDGNKSFAVDCIDPERINPDGMCPMIFAPVCGCDGKTYPNACVAANAGLISWEDGACE